MDCAMFRNNKLIMSIIEDLAYVLRHVLNSNECSNCADAKQVWAVLRYRTI